MKFPLYIATAIAFVQLFLRMRKIYASKYYKYYAYRFV